MSGVAAGPAQAGPPVDAADTFGWDIGGAHVKACRQRAGRVQDVVQWPCPLWLGLQHLAQVLTAAQARWPGLGQARHAVTMTGEMADLFADRQDGVRRIAAVLASQLGAGPAMHFYAGDAGWCGASDVATHWQAIASANWLASARHAALVLADPPAAGPGRVGRQGHPASTDSTASTGRPDSPEDNRHAEGVLIDIGSTTTDLIAFRNGRVLTTARTDHQRLASGELVYQGVVRTPLCALARRLPWRGARINVINELFATSADVYRLTGELAPAHDQQPSADGAAKTLAASRQRLARLVGLDAHDASDADWLALAQAWRAEQVAELRGQLARVVDQHGLGRQALLVTAGCGDFLAPLLVAGDVAGDVAAAVHGAADTAGQPGASPRCRPYAQAVARLAPDALAGSAAWAQVCAPSVAVAALLLHDSAAAAKHARPRARPRPRPARPGPAAVPPARAPLPELR